MKRKSTISFFYNNAGSLVAVAVHRRDGGYT